MHTQPQRPHLEWKPGEDWDCALYTVISLEPRRAPGNNISYWLKEYGNL